jgi:cytochrome oxidase Cu insertion factor (SCO1/SenC/PrrC family)
MTSRRAGERPDAGVAELELDSSPSRRSAATLSTEEAVALAGLMFMFVVTAAWWALALWPVSNAPFWLERTRYVCFGVGGSGLPDAGGWIGLIAGPLGMLTILLVGYRSSFGTLLVRARTSVPIAAVFAVLALGTLALVGGAGARVMLDTGAVYAQSDDGLPPDTYPRLDWDTPPLELLAHDGAVRSLASLGGRPVIVTFAYAHCSTICPLIIRDALDAQRALRADGIPAAVLVVTLDPWRDTPSRLKDMAASWGFEDGHAWLLGGSVSDVESTLDAWRVPRQRDPLNGEVTHPSLAYIVDVDGTLAYASNGGAAALASLVQRLVQ